MKILSVEQMRRADADAINALGIAGMTLMSKAGAAVARMAARCAAARGTRRIVVVAGHGNNGGDACVAARCLYEDGFNVQVVMTRVPAVLKGDAREAWDEMRTAGVPYLVLAAPESWDADIAVASGSMLRNGIVIDGVLGTGCSGEPTGTSARAIQWINGMRRHALVVAIDLPSGVHGDTGEVMGEGVHADVTVTFARPKQCFLNPRVAERAGHLVVADIGIPDAVCDASVVATQREMIALPEISQWFKPRAYDSHKGDFGHLAIMGGSARFPFAPLLSAMGAVRCGAGLVSLALPEQGVPAVGALLPEVMAQGLAMQDGVLSDHTIVEWWRTLSRTDVMVAGPGMTNCAATRRVVANLLREYSGSLVLDADGLNVLAELRKRGEFQPHTANSLILLPHAGEAGRLLGLTARDVQGNRVEMVRRVADTYQAVVALKGAGTLVCEAGGAAWLNLTGNPGMASGGTGDVLAGVVGALRGRGLTAFQAVAAGVWAHGTAGDFAAMELGESGVSATTLAEKLPRTIRMAAGR